jgi:hypothetical protein
MKKKRKKKKKERKIADHVSWLLNPINQPISLLFFLLFSFLSPFLSFTFFHFFSSFFFPFHFPPSFRLKKKKKTAPRPGDTEAQGFARRAGAQPARTNAPVARPSPAAQAPMVAAGDQTALHQAAQHNNLHQAKAALARNGNSLDAPDSLGRTPLMHAVHHDAVDVARFLLQQGANCNFRESSFGFTALHEAAYCSSPAMM